MFDIRPRIVDLFCGAGGAAEGYFRAGFDVTGVDIDPQPSYPFKFVQADALKFDLSDFDAIHASPECQNYCWGAARWRAEGKVYPDQLESIRKRLIRSWKPYVIENVPTAPLVNPVYLEGTMFGLQTIRRRGFETNFRVAQPKFRRRKRTIMQQSKTEPGKMIKKSAYCQVAGNGADSWSCRVGDWRVAMGIDWMNRKEIVQAIPPAYTQHVGRYLMGQFR